MAVKDYVFRKNKPKKRPGVHAKAKISRNPNSKTYQKRYRGQGR